MNNMFAVNPIQVNDLEKYLRTFLNMETAYQNHQVYFTPHIEDLQCNLCKAFVKYNAVQEHIDTNPHKSNVLFNYELLSNQVVIYGISKDEIVKKEEMEKEEHVVKKSVVKDRERSTSGTEADECIVKSVDSTTSKDLLDLVPNRFKGHTKCMQTRPKTIESCKVDQKQDVNISENHINQQSHMKNANAVLTEARTECITCSTIRYGNELSLNHHLLINGIVKEELPPRVKRMFKNTICIQNLGKRLSTEATKVLENRQLKNDCCKAIEDLLHEIFPGCKAYPFGSRMSGLGISDSDLDIFLDVGGMYSGYKCQDAQSQALFVKNAEIVFGRNKNIMLNVLSIPTARTPIVRLYHIQTGLNCDISFRHGLSIENTKFVRYCIELQPITQSLILILKQWSHYLGLDEYITSYALVMLVIFYMQTKKYLPSVKAIRELNPGPLTIIAGWETINYSAPVKVIQYTLRKHKGDTADILADFFRYYAVFDYKLLVVCPLMGRTISKKTFTQQNGRYLPEEMKPYKEKQHGEKFRVSPLCIQDPFDLGHNITRNYHIGTITKFKDYCELSMKLLMSEINCK